MENEDDKETQEFVDSISAEFIKAAQVLQNIANLNTKYERDLAYPYIKTSDTALTSKLHNQYHNARHLFLESIEACGWSSSSMSC